MAGMDCSGCSLCIAGILSSYNQDRTCTDEDMGTVFVNVTTPPGSSLAQTKKAMEQIDERIREIPQIKLYSNVSGYSMMGGQAASGGMLIIKLKHWDERTRPEDNINAVLAQIYARTADIKSAKLFAFAQPTITGYGMGSGLNFMYKTVPEVT